MFAFALALKLEVGNYLDIPYLVKWRHELFTLRHELFA